MAPGTERFLHHPALVEAARRIHGRDIIVPAIAYANLLLPGQELAVHTDVPEFRGADRRRYPQWLMVVMLHSGLFDAWRMPIATGISYFGDAGGGELSFWRTAQRRPVELIEPRHNMAVVTDTDRAFHGVDRVGAGDEPAPPVGAGMVMVPQEATAAGPCMTATRSRPPTARRGAVLGVLEGVLLRRRRRAAGMDVPLRRSDP